MEDTFSNLNILKISEIINRIGQEFDSINLNNNLIKKAKLEILPTNIFNINIDNNYINEISWDDRDWGTISMENNRFETSQFEELNCKSFILDNNNIEDITFVNCVIEQLSIVNNRIRSINFFDCKIKKLDISSNNIKEIITLPEGLIIFKCSSNYLTNISAKFEDTLKYIQLSDNLLNSIPKLSTDLLFLDLSKNKFKNFNIDNLPGSLKCFDISENDIPNCKEIFGKLNIEKLSYDINSDDDFKDGHNSDYSSDTDSSLSVQLNYKFNSFHSKQINMNENVLNDDLIDDDEITNALEEYQELIKNNSDDAINDKKQSISSDSSDLSNSNDFLSGINLDDFVKKDGKYIVYTNNDTANIEQDNDTANIEQESSQRNLMLTAAIERFKESDKQNFILKKNYPPTIPVTLQWNFNL